MTEGDPEAGNDVSGKIKDLNHDGKQEFLLSSRFGEIKDQCSGDWTAIFAWTGGGYTNVSRRFKDFYRQQLDSLNQKISALHPIVVYGGGFSEPRDKECLIAEAAMLQRYLGISPEAGLDQAIRFGQERGSREALFCGGNFRLYRHTGRAALCGDIGQGLRRRREIRSKVLPFSAVEGASAGCA